MQALNRIPLSPSRHQPGSNSGASKPGSQRIRMPAHGVEGFASSDAQADSLPSSPIIHAVEGAAVAAPAICPGGTPLATLLSRHIIRDGEIILLILKPSRWFIVLSSLRFVALVLIVLIGAHLRLRGHLSPYIEAGVFCIAGRVMGSVLNWMGRLYILTDQRIVRLSGVFNVEIFDCPLRKVSRTRMVGTFRERLLRLGSIEIVPQDEDRPWGVWQTLARPQRVNERISAAIRRAKMG